MTSTTSRSNKTLNAMEPKRRNGKLRVAAILKAGAAVIAEKGYDAATMAEIAARSDTRIGSLYRFFPNKEILANTLINHYHEYVDTAFKALEAQIPSLSLSALADALLDLMVTLHKRASSTVSKLLDTSQVLSVKRGEFRQSIHKHIAKVVSIRADWLSKTQGQDIATVVLHAMKTMAAFSDATDKNIGSGAMAELREMTQLYFKHRLKKN